MRADLEKWLLVGLYSPARTDLNAQRHLLAAMDWLKRAQDAGSDHVSLLWGPLRRPRTGVGATVREMAVERKFCYRDR